MNLLERTQRTDILTLRQKLYQRLAVVVSRPSVVIKPTYHLAQMYGTALEFLSVLNKVFTRGKFEMASQALCDVLELREIAADLQFHVTRFALAYATLDAYLPDRANIHQKAKKSCNLPAGQALVEIHQTHSSVLQNSLLHLGCSEAVAFSFTDNLLDLAHELSELVIGVERLLEACEDDELTSILFDLAFPWVEEIGQGIYHLGEYESEDANLYNPGFLGWSLILVCELTTQQ